METVPNIISTKDFSYLSDMFQWNFVAAKEISHFASHVEKEEIKVVLEDIAMMHADHCRFLLSILQGGEEDEQQED